MQRFPSRSAILILLVALCTAGLLVWILGDGAPVAPLPSEPPYPDISSPEPTLQTVDIEKLSYPDEEPLQESSTYAVTGVVTNTEGKPLPGVEVVLGSLHGISAENGVFSLPILEFKPDGDAGVLTGSKEGYGRGSLRIGRRMYRDVRLVLPPPAMIRGRIVGERGPIPDATIEVKQGSSEWTVDVDDGGLFSLPDTSSSECRVTARAPGRVPASVDVTPGVTPRYVEVFLASTMDVPLRVVDEMRSPVAGALVSVSWESRHDQIVGTSDADGVAMRVPVAAHGAIVIASASGFATTQSSMSSLDRQGGGVTIVLRKEAPIRVRVSPVTHASEWSIALALNAYDRRKKDTEVAVEERGTPPPIGRPAQTSAGDGVVWDDNWMAFDREGHAILRGAYPGGTYTIVIVRRNSKGEEVSARHIVWRIASLAETGIDIQCDLPSLVGVSLDVMDEAGSPVVQTLSISGSTLDRRRGLRVSTDVSGKSQFWLLPGRYTVVTSPADPYDRSLPLEVRETPVRLTITVARGHRLDGRLLTSGGVPLPRRNVQVRVATGWRTATSDDSGFFRFARLPPGEYDVVFDGVRGEQGIGGKARAKVPGPPLKLVPATTTLRGRVEPRPGTPLVLTLRPVGQRDWISAMVSEDGAFEVAEIAPVVWLLQLKSLSGSGSLIPKTEVDAATNQFVTLYREK